MKLARKSRLGAAHGGVLWRHGGSELDSIQALPPDRATNWVQKLPDGAGHARPVGATTEVLELRGVTYP